LRLQGALLGAGNIALTGHLPAYAAVGNHGGGCDIVAAADPRCENLNRIKELVPGIRTFETAAALLDSVRPDFVDICAPPSEHRALIEQALDGGCHILCEKPLSLTPFDAHALAGRLRAAPVVFMPCHQYHYAPAWSNVRSALDAGEIGRLRYAAITIEREHANAGNRHWNPAWRTCSAISGGGILMDHGTHLFYQLRALLGDPMRVAARIETRLHFEYDVEDTACCYLDFGSALLRLHLTWAGRRRKTVHRYFGDAGSLTCDEGTIEITGRAGTRRLPLEQGFSADSGHSGWYVPLLIDFLNRIERNDLDRSPLDEALATMRWTAAAYASARLGRPLPLGEGVGLI